MGALGGGAGAEGSVVGDLGEDEEAVSPESMGAKVGVGWPAALASSVAFSCASMRW